MFILLHDFGGYPFSAQLARYLAQHKGHRVAYVCAHDSFAACRSQRPDEIAGLSFYAIDHAIEKGTTWRRPMSEAAFGRLVNKQIDMLKPDIVVSANAPLETQHVIVKKCQADALPFVYWLQDLHGPAISLILKSKLGLVGSLIGWRYKQLEASMLRRSDAVIPIADEFCHYLNECGVKQNKVSILRNWAPIDETPCLDRNNAWARTHELVGKKVLMYAGTLGYKHDTAIFKSLSHAFQNDASVVIVVVSSGTKADELRQSAATSGLTNLRVIPRQPYELLPDVLASADALLSVLEVDASTYSIPSKVLTYLCAGRAVILMMPAENQSARIVSQCGAGIVLGHRSVEAIVEAARGLFHDGDRARQCGQNARQYAEKTFDIEAISERFERILTGCMSPSPA